MQQGKVTINAHGGRAGLVPQDDGYSSSRASDHDRDGTIAVLNHSLEVGQLTLDEHSERVETALEAKTLNELSSLTADLTPEKTAAPTRSRLPQLLGLLVASVALLVVAVAITNHNNQSGPLPPQRVTTTTSDLFATPPSYAPSPLHVAIASPTEYAAHDPANQCGSFPGGGANCYVVVRFTNPTKRSVTFIPVDLQMDDQFGNQFRHAPVLPACYDTVDVNGYQDLRPGKSVDFQLCFPVIVGSLPHTMKGIRSLTGVSLAVPTSSIHGLWGGL
jgi:hypothetical protein